MIATLHRRQFPVSTLHLFASARSAGKTCNTPYGDLIITLFSVEAARACDVVFLAVSGTFAKEHAKAIAAQPNGALVIDNSSAFRYDDDIPLVVPEINCETAQGQYLIANPNCTTAIAAVVLWPIHQTYGLEKVMISTYQASSGAGAAGMAELKEGTACVLKGEDSPANTFAHPLAFNVIPHIDSFQDNGYTREELKVVWETRKIFNLPELALSCTCVRVPTLRAHAESLIIETRDEVTPEGTVSLPFFSNARCTVCCVVCCICVLTKWCFFHPSLMIATRILLSNSAGVLVKDDTSTNTYPMPLTASGCDDVEVGRIRQSLIFGKKGLELFVCGDQLLKGAALNAVQIAEEMYSKGWLTPSVVDVEGKK